MDFGGFTSDILAKKILLLTVEYCRAATFGLQSPPATGYEHQIEVIL